MSFGAEDRLHQWLRRELRKRGFDRLGDDGAILPEKGPWAVTQDHQIEDVHFPGGTDPDLIARRLLAVNLSDLAAMGAEPAYGFLALSCPASFDRRRFFTRFLVECDRQGVELAGGDLAQSRLVSTTLTLMGTRIPGGRWLERSHGQPGDRLWLAGNLGLSALGRRLLEVGATRKGRGIQLPESLELTASQQRLARRAVRSHLVPEPQLRVSRWLARRRRVAAIDISDGLALDLHRLCRESSVGARLDYSALANDRVFESLSQALGRESQALILAGGEDYALLIALPPQINPPESLGCRLVGELVGNAGVALVSNDTTCPLPAQGWDHFESMPVDTS